MRPDGVIRSYREVSSGATKYVNHNYDGKAGPICTFVAVLGRSEQKSVTDKVGEGFKVNTTQIKDTAYSNTALVSHGASQSVCHRMVGYSSLNNRLVSAWARRS